MRLTGELEKTKNPLFVSATPSATSLGLNQQRGSDQVHLGQVPRAGNLPVGPRSKHPAFYPLCRPSRRVSSHALPRLGSVKPDVWRAYDG
jgi:hypothetical protein